SLVLRSEPRGNHQISGSAGRFQHEWRGTLIQRVVVALVEEIVDEQLDLPVLVDLRFDEGVETPVAWNRRTLVRGQQGAAVDLRAVDRLSAEFPDIRELILRQKTEGLM